MQKNLLFCALRAESISDAALRLFLNILFHFEQGPVLPSIADMAEELGWDEKKTKNTFGQLVSLGCLCPAVTTKAKTAYTLNKDAVAVAAGFPDYSKASVNLTLGVNILRSKEQEDVTRLIDETNPIPGLLEIFKQKYAQEFGHTPIKTPKDWRCIKQLVQTHGVHGVGQMITRFFANKERYVSPYGFAVQGFFVKREAIWREVNNGKPASTRGNANGKQHP